MILTSHYMEDIERLCRRIVILREGEQVFDGSLQQVVEQYADHKQITAHTRKSEAAADPTLLRSWGEILECTETRIRLKTPRARVADAASFLLREYPVVDLA